MTTPGLSLGFFSCATAWFVIIPINTDKIKNHIEHLQLKFFSTLPISLIEKRRTSSAAILSVSRAARGLVHLLQRLINGEARRLLARRKLFESRQEWSDDRLRRQHQVAAVEEPVVVRVRRDVGALERIGPQIEELRNAQRCERLRPDPHRPRHALF